ncbi:hypothetical protein M378DRAFT_66356 [Amanita muscaria Koide BX008]|uniref:Ino eighty subunit 1 n=1 Tax=Amanita muscaria (strain Koide BX008) TaxID=946122 RepID=A0A0C2TTJ7_AMAMK|nr:hypothetical protein M378DRAFT_66356 [Amanita muscaria Koide BX008]
MSSRRQSPTPRRVVPIKRADGEPLTRSDIQYDLLSTIFNDDTDAFTNPWKKSTLTSFKDLYIDAILNSPKATKALKDKMISSPLFATSFAMLSLLVNVGRINTTMSFFPEMKTAIRTYHPIPALQKTEGNLQDAPRIKHILKASLLAEEANASPITPQDIISRSNEGRRPSTSITNLLFVLASHSKYFKATEDYPQLDFLDLFLRTEASSASRGQAFLWTCWKFLEQHNDDKSNPFSEPGAAAPTFVLLSREQALLENVDPEEDKIIAEKLIASRSQIVINNSIKEAQKEAVRTADDLSRELQASTVDDKLKAHHHELSSTRIKAAQAAKDRKAMADKTRRERMREKARERPEESDGDGQEFVDRQSDLVTGDTRPRQVNYMSQPSSSHHHRSLSPGARSSTHHQRRYAPYKSHKHEDYVAAQLQRMRTALPPSMTMLQYAWHTIVATDPLVDSDEELGDDNTRLDYREFCFCPYDLT